MSGFERYWEKMMDYLANEEIWITFSEKAIKILLILIVAKVIVSVVKSAIHKVFVLRTKSPLRLSEKREMTLQRLIQNIVTYVVYFIVLIMILDELNVPVKSLLAGAGILGLAVGFGAQNLVRDIITGFFIVFEAQFAVGDYIRTGNFEGYVQEIGLRTTKIKNWTGELHILPNSRINEVTNFSVNNSVAVVDVSIAYEEDIEKAEKTIQDYIATLKDKYEEIVSEPQVLGVQTLGGSEVVIRVTAETTPMNHMKIARLLRKEIKQYLEEHDIEIPYPKMILYNHHHPEQSALDTEAK